MKITYEAFVGMNLSFGPDEIIESLETLRFVKKQVRGSMQGEVVAEYFINLLEDEIRAGPQ